MHLFIHKCLTFINLCFQPLKHPNPPPPPHFFSDEFKDNRNDPTNLFKMTDADRPANKSVVKYLLEIKMQFNVTWIAAKQRGIFHVLSKYFHDMLFFLSAYNICNTDCYNHLVTRLTHTGPLISQEGSEKVNLPSAVALCLYGIHYSLFINPPPEQNGRRFEMRFHEWKFVYFLSNSTHVYP